MRALQIPLSLLDRCWGWIRHSKNAGLYFMLVALILIPIAQWREYHAPYVPAVPVSSMDLPKGWEPPADGSYFVAYILAYMKLIALLGGVVYHVYLIRAYPNLQKMVKPTWVVCGYLAVWAVAVRLYERWEATHIGFTGKVFSDMALSLEILLLLGLLAAVPIAISYYSRCILLERYVMRSFLQPLMFCFVAFFTLWIVMDLLDNLQDFQENKVKTAQILIYYLKMAPFIYVTVAPISLLLATVYTMGRMSRTNEIISMLGAGRSMGQVLQPVLVAGCMCSYVGMVANFEFGPTAAANKEQLVGTVSERLRQDELAVGVVYRNEEEGRTWFLGSVPTDLRHGKMRRVEIRQEDENGRLVKAWFAKSAFWWPDPGVWALYGGAEVDYKNGQVMSIRNFELTMQGLSRYDLVGFSETPWTIMSSSLAPDFLGVPDLISYLRANANYDEKKLAPFWTHLFYRFALPWQCIIVVLFAAPLAVVFSRRGLVGGIANAVIIFFVLMFLDNLFLNLGRTARMPSFVAVWMSHLFLGLLGLYLFRLRSRNRELPSLSFAKIREWILEAWEHLRRRFFLNAQRRVES